MSTSVVVVAHRVHDWLELCIRSVRDQADEVIVVDNGSEDEAVSVRAHAAGARTVRLSENAGFPAGVNAGVAEAAGDLIALLNDDAMAEPGWLASAATELEDPTVGAVTPKLVFANPFAVLRLDDEPIDAPGDPRSLGRSLRSVTVDGVEILERLLGPGIHRLEVGDLDGLAGRWRWTTGRDPIYIPLPAGDQVELRVNGAQMPITETVPVINSAGTYLSSFGFGGDYGFGSPDDGSFDTSADRFGGCGAALVTRAETLARIGGMVSDFFAYYEDLDWCWRNQLGGLRIRYQPAGVVRHVGGLTTGGPAAPRVVSLAARNRILCLARNAPLRVLPRETKRALTMDPPRGLARALARRVPRALAQRHRLASTWVRGPGEVWDMWAGVNERWPASPPGG